MPELQFTIREEQPDDLSDIRRVHILAFGRDAEANLVDKLRKDGLFVTSVVAVDHAEIIGQALFSELKIENERGSLPAVALAPVAVLPVRQRSGIGSALIRAGIEICRERGKAAIIVLGNPLYYSRFGFGTSLAAKLTGPFSGEHWMALELQPDVLAAGGVVTYPEAFELVG